MTRPEDRILDNLYSDLFNQMLRVRNNPTFVEKNVMDDMANLLRNYILGFTEKIREDIKKYEQRKTTSSLVWDKEYYTKLSQDKYAILDEFESKLKDCYSDRLIEKNFSKTNSIIDDIYSDWFPKSEMREIYLEYFESIKEIGG